MANARSSHLNETMTLDQVRRDRKALLESLTYLRKAYGEVVTLDEVRVRLNAELRDGELGEALQGVRGD